MFASHLGSIKDETSDIKKLSTQRNEITVTENSQSGDTEALTAPNTTTVQAATTNTEDCNVLILGVTEPKGNICDIRPEWPKCNLCRIRILSSKPSELMISKD